MLEGPEEIVVVGRPGPQRDDLELAARRRHGAVVVVVEPGREDIPLLVGRDEVDGRAAAYVCRGFVCERRSEEHPSELQSLMRISYAVFCLQKKKKRKQN